MIHEIQPMLKFREPFNAISHLIGALAALLAVILLISLGKYSTSQATGILIYGISLVGMFTASGLYHSVVAKPRTITILRKIDHSAIYLLIAGTYTPFCLIAFDGFWRWGLMGIIWSIALLGVGIKIFLINTPRWITAGVYLLMGWLSLFAIREMIIQLPFGALCFLLAGGLCYTSGAIIYITRKGNPFPGVFGFHEIWHIFVLLGAGAHFAAVVFML